MKEQDISPLDLQAGKEDDGIGTLELLAAWSCCDDVAISDEDAEWIDDQIAAGMLEREFLPPEVFHRVMQIYESVDLTEQTMQRHALWR